MKVGVEEARRIAVRAQALDGSATACSRPCGGSASSRSTSPAGRAAAAPRPLQPARPRYDRAELDRLLWEERELFEWNAFI